MVYAVGSASLVVRATYVNEKSFRRSAARSTSDATSVEAKDATSAFRAEYASRRRPSRAAAAPATSAYTDRPSVTRRAARPSSAMATGWSGGVAARLSHVLRRALRDHRARLCH